MNVLEDYYCALDRLVKGCPQNVPIGSKINRDTVALEAGRKRGSIKRSRETFAGLISDIELAARNSIPRDKTLAEKLKSTKLELKELKLRYLESLNREVMLSNRILELEAIVEADNVYKIRRAGSR